MEGSERQSRSVVVVGIVPKLLKMLHKRLGLLSFPNGKRAVPPTENGGGKKTHTQQQQQDDTTWKKAQTCSSSSNKLYATKMLRCSCSTTALEEHDGMVWSPEQGTSIYQWNRGRRSYSSRFYSRIFPQLIGLVSRRRVKGAKDTRVGQELFEGDSVLEMTVAQNQIGVVSLSLGMDGLGMDGARCFTLFEVWRGQLLLLGAGFLCQPSIISPWAIEICINFKSRKTNFNSQQEALSAMLGISKHCYGL